MFVDPQIQVELPIKIRYSVASPKAHFISADASTDGQLITATFWYQVLSPDLLNPTRTISVTPISALGCASSSIPPNAVPNVIVATEYPTGTSKTNVAGTYFEVQLQWAGSTAPTGCKQTGTLTFNLTTKSGESDSVAVPVI